MSETWGKGSENNTVGYGQGAQTSTIGWGESHKTSYAGLTDIVGDPSLSISYPASALCENASNPTPTVSGNEGSGTFSSTAGLVFVSTSTGEVNISSSTAGATYLITYTDTNAATATFSLTINNLDNAAFAYSASSYEPTGLDPTPTITGLTGGTFSSTSGLVFVDSGTNTGSSTGQIDLSATTEATYTITYDTTSSGSSVCPNTSTQTVDIALSGISNVYSMAFDGSDNYIDAGISLGNSLGVYNGSLTISLWYKHNANAYNHIFNMKPSDSSTHGELTILNYNSGSNNVIYCQVNQNTGATYKIDYTTTYDTNWHHLVFKLIYNSGAGTFGLELYIDGTSVGTASGTVPTTGTIDFTNGSTFIGGGIANRYYNGNIDEVAVWNTALTSTQIQSIYNATGTNITSDLSTIESSSLKYWNRMGD